MIDVVFLLLIFFIVTIKPEDLLAALPVSAPAPSKPPITVTIPMLKINVVSNGGYVINGRHISEDALERKLKKIAEFTPNQEIILVCDMNSEHSKLVTALDICAKAKLGNLFIFSQ